MPRPFWTLKYTESGSVGQGKESMIGDNRQRGMNVMRPPLAEHWNENGRVTMSQCCFSDPMIFMPNNETTFGSVVKFMVG